MLAFLPSYTWDIDPVFFRVSRSYIVYALVALGVAAALYGLLKKIKDQVVTGLILLALALVAHTYMSDPAEFRYYSLLFVVVFLGGHALLNWQIKRGGGSSEEASDFIVYGVLAVLVGARLGHVLFYDLEKALDDPTWVFMIWTGGLASHGAVIGLILAMYLFTKRRGIPFLEGSDRFAFSAALGATVVRLGNLINSEIIGRVTDQSWGIRFPRAAADANADPVPLRYPSQLYEIALGIAVLIGLLIADKAMGKEKRPRGALIAWFFALYFTGRFFTEFYKEFEAISPDSPLTMGQYLSVPGALLGWYGLYWAFKHKDPAGWGLPEERDEEDEEDEEEAQAEDEEERDEEEAAAEEEEDEEADEGDSDEEGDEDSTGEDSEDEDEDDESAEPAKKPAVKKEPAAKKPSGDPDVDEEFEGGRLKREKKPVDED